ncbi:hypothetical protein JCM14076_24730 [Methylosoma difficile]
MNKDYKKIIHVVAVINLCSLLAWTASADELKGPPAASPETVAKYSAIKAKALGDENHQVIKEASDTLLQTEKALLALEKNDPKNALTLLHEVDGKLSAILAKYPDMTFVSANIDTQIIEFEGDANAIQSAIDKADDYFDDGKIQDARQILDELISEVRITLRGLPLKTFPTAIKEAELAAASGKTADAANGLYSALNTLDEITEVIPLPLLHAEILLTQASETEHQLDISQTQNRTEVSKLTAAAKDQLKLAQLLGYGNTSDYKLLYTAIDEIDSVIFSEKSAAAWSNIKQHISDLKNKLTYFKK